MSDTDWFHEAFLSHYEEYYEHRDEEEAKLDVKFAIEHLDLNEKSFVLDLCSGAGRHSNLMAKLCRVVLALDLSSDLLISSIKTSKEIGNQNIFHVNQDVRFLHYFECFDQVVSFFNSFGYFQENDSDLLFLSAVHRSLVSGGKFLLDIMNPQFLKDHLVEESEKETSKYIFIEKRKILNSENRVEKNVEVRDKSSGKKIRSYTESVRFYEAEEIYALLKKAGFSEFRSFGDHKGSTFVAGSPRHLITTCKV